MYEIGHPHPIAEIRTSDVFPPSMGPSFAIFFEKGSAAVSVFFSGDKAKAQPPRCEDVMMLSGNMATAICSQHFDVRFFRQAAAEMEAGPAITILSNTPPW